MPNEETIQKMSIVDPIQVNVNIPNFEGKPGRDGTDGRDGDDAYRIAVRNGFLGTEKEWLLTLKGQDGKSASAPTARQELLKNNIWCNDDTVDSVFTAIIGNWGKPMPRTEFKPLTVPVVVAGQKSVTLTGEPHYKVKIVGYNELHEIGDDGTIVLSLPMAIGEDDYRLEYFNYTDTKVGDATIQGVTENATAPDDTYEQYGIKYSLFGKTLYANVVGFNGYPDREPIFLGKWTPQQVEKVVVKVARPTIVYVNGDYTFETMGNIPVFVDNPQNLQFGNARHMDDPIQLGSLADGVKPVSFRSSKLEWSDAQKTFINTGDAVDHL